MKLIDKFVGLRVAEQDERGAEGISKVDTLVRNGGDVTIKMHVTEGNIKIVEANP